MSARMSTSPVYSLLCVPSCLGSLQYMAPEVVTAQAPTSKAGGYGFSCDVWSAGVLLYALLAMAMPFRPQEGDATLVAPSAWRPLPDDVTVSSAAQEFLASLLQADCSRRPGAAQACGHAWLRDVVG